MTDNFKVFRKKFMIIAALTAAAVGVCLGLLVTGALLLALRLNAIALAWWIYVLVGLGVAALCGTAAYFIIRPSDERIARKLDRDFALGQKVQTMVEFSAEEQPAQMVLMQRRQTDEALGEVAKKRLKMGWLWKFAFIPVLAAAMFLGGILAPVQKRVDPDYEAPVAATDTQLQALRDLIADVESSDLTQTVKPRTLEELNSLLGKLETIKTPTQRKQDAIYAINAIDGAIEATISYTQVCSAISDDQIVAPLGTAIFSAATYYQSGKNPVTMAEVRSYQEQALNVIPAALYGWTEQFMAQFKDVTIISSISQTVTTFANTLYSQLFDEENNPNVPALGTSPIYDSLQSLISSLMQFAASGGNGQSADVFKSNLRGICNTAADALVPELTVQSYSGMMNDYIRDALVRIFRLSAQDISGDEEQNDPSGDEEQPPADGGGFGEGEIIVGGNDLVLDASDPSDPHSVPYADIIADYNGIISEQIDKGTTKEELILLYNKFYEYLYGGMEQGE